MDMLTYAMLTKKLAGKASLVDGKVPASELPSYVDDVLEYSSTSAFPVEGERGKIYIALDTNTSYRWSGSTYIAITGQSDWDQSDNTAPDYIKNKPTIPAAQVNADWDAASGVAQILNKPTLGAAAAADTTTAITSGGTGLPTSGTVYTDQRRQETEIGVVANAGAKNLSKVSDGSGTRYLSVPIVLSPGDYAVSFLNLQSIDTDATTCQVLGFKNGTQVSDTLRVNRGNNVSGVLTITSETDSINIYASDTYAHGDGDTFSFSGFMLRHAEITDGTYVPYAPSNRELYMALEAKTSLEAVFGRGTAIQSNTDLNDIKQLGKYYSLNSSVSGTLTNAPITTSGFVMSVENNYQDSSGIAGVIQTATVTGTSAVDIYRRAYRASGGVWGWTPWIKFEGTALQAGT